MEKCFIASCKQQPIGFCNCSNNKIYCCKEHINIHINSWTLDDNGEHKITSLLSKIPQGFIDSCKRSLESLEVVDNFIKCQRKVAIAHIKASTEPILLEIKNLLNIYSEIIQSVSADEYVNKSMLLGFLPYFNSIYMYSAFDKQKRLLAQISTAFSNIYFKQSHEACLYWDYSANLLKSVNLATRKSSPIEFKKSIHDSKPQEITNFFVSCQVGENIFFLKERERPTFSYLLSIEEKTIEELPRKNDPYDYSACVLNNSVVHLFRNSSIQYEGFDLSLKNWITLPNLPKLSNEITAGVLRSNIIYSGLSISEVYQFKESKFEVILKLALNTHKVICPGWIVTDKLLYENTKDSSTWVEYTTTLTYLNNSSSTVLINKHFIYFVSCSSSLIRIDTLKKSIESLGISN